MEWVEVIRRYIPVNEQEQKDREIILYSIETFDDVLTRNNGILHMTSSAFVINKQKSKVLMVYHNIYNSWSWIGGHADGEADLLSVAIRETKEETGVINVLPVIQQIYSLDVLPVLGHKKRGKYIPAHLHLSICYLLEVDENDRLIVKEDENCDVRWIPIEQVCEFSTEPHMKKLYEKLILKLRNIG